MCAEEPIDAVADALGDSMAVAVPGEALGTVEDLAGTEGNPEVVGIGDVTESSDAVSDVGIVVLALDGTSCVTDRVRRVADVAAGFTVAVFDGHEETHVEPAVLDAVRRAVDVTVLACRPHSPTDSSSERWPTTDARARESRYALATGCALDFVSLIHTAGHINLDLADVKTVLTDGSVAAFGGGTTSLGGSGPREAIRRAFGNTPPSIDLGRGSSALVSVVGGPAMTIDDTVAALRAVRDEIGDTSDLVWDVAIDDSLTDRVTVDVIVDDIVYRPPLSAGDPCRQCGSALSVYTMGEQETVACEDCGFADLSLSLRGRPASDEEP
jgi:hypothetical protein